MKTLRRETFDEVHINNLRYQFFELRLWRWHWPRCFKSEQEIVWVLPFMNVRRWR